MNYSRRVHADMDISTASLDLGPVDYLGAAGAYRHLEQPVALRPISAPEPEQLRRIAWEIGERRCGDAYAPRSSHVGLAMVHPTQGFAYWQILPGWVEQTARSRRSSW